MLHSNRAIFAGCNYRNYWYDKKRFNCSLNHDYYLRENAVYFREIKGLISKDLIIVKDDSDKVQISRYMYINQGIYIIIVKYIHICRYIYIYVCILRFCYSIFVMTIRRNKLSTIINIALSLSWKNYDSLTKVIGSKKISKPLNLKF